jgi:hypothetical protein
MKLSAASARKPATPQAQAQNLGLQAESARLKALVDARAGAAPPTTARSCRGCALNSQKQSEQLDAYLQALRNQLNSQRHEAERWKAPNCWRKQRKPACRHRRAV